MREWTLAAFENIGGVEAYTKWAKTHPKEFYAIAARMIPAEQVVTGDPNQPVHHRVEFVVVDR